MNTSVTLKTTMDPIVYHQILDRSRRNDKGEFLKIGTVPIKVTFQVHGPPGTCERYAASLQRGGPPCVFGEVVYYDGSIPERYAGGHCDSKLSPLELSVVDCSAPLLTLGVRRNTLPKTANHADKPFKFCFFFDDLIVETGSFQIHGTEPMKRNDRKKKFAEPEALSCDRLDRLNRLRAKARRPEAVPSTHGGFGPMGGGGGGSGGAGEPIMPVAVPVPDPSELRRKRGRSSISAPTAYHVSRDGGVGGGVAGPRAAASVPLVLPMDVRVAGHHDKTGAIGDWAVPDAKGLWTSLGGLGESMESMDYESAASSSVYSDSTHSSASGSFGSTATPLLDELDGVEFPPLVDDFLDGFVVEAEL